ncbi:hypothetical protein V1506DRAFT_510341 [Lipomyces tetrasporus]
MDAPIRHKKLTFRPTTGKKEDKDCCDDECVGLSARALCQKECHVANGDVCTTHESVANHYSSLRKNARVSSRQAARGWLRSTTNDVFNFCLPSTTTLSESISIEK